MDQSLEGSHFWVLQDMLEQQTLEFFSWIQWSKLNITWSGRSVIFFRNGIHFLWSRNKPMTTYVKWYFNSDMPVKLTLQAQIRYQQECVTKKNCLGQWYASQAHPIYIATDNSDSSIYMPLNQRRFRIIGIPWPNNWLVNQCGVLPSDKWLGIT